MAGGGRGVLVVEDHEATRMLLEDALSLEGYRVRTAADATAGLAILRDWRPDAIVLDALLPDLSAAGFRAAQRALPAADVPVLLISATVTERLEETAREVGAAAWLPKPFDLDALVTAVAQLTGR